MSVSVLRRLKSKINKENEKKPLHTNGNFETIEEKIKDRNSKMYFLVVIIFTLTISVGVLYKIFTQKNAFNLDIVTTVTILLAFFSIYLSSIFYFKTTEQSNAFYDRSYKHTKDIAESLSNMKGEFGKSLSMIEQYSNDMRTKFDDFPMKILEQTGSIQKKFDEINEEVSSSEMSEDDKKRFEEMVHEQQDRINQLKYELERVNNEYSNHRNVNYSFLNNNKSNRVEDRIRRNYYVKNFSEPILNYTSKDKLDKNELNKAFHKARKNNEIPELIIQELKFEEKVDLGINITDKGYNFFLNLLS